MATIVIGTTRTMMLNWLTADGTRGASESLGTTVKAGHTYIGAYIVDNRNTSAFNATVQGNGPNNTAHLCAYRATGNAVSNASVTVRKVWLKTGGA